MRPSPQAGQRPRNPRHSACPALVGKAFCAGAVDRTSSISKVHIHHFVMPGLDPGIHDESQ